MKTSDLSVEHDHNPKLLHQYASHEIKIMKTSDISVEHDHDPKFLHQQLSRKQATWNFLDNQKSERRSKHNMHDEIGKSMTSFSINTQKLTKYNKLDAIELQI